MSLAIRALAALCLACTAARAGTDDIRFACDLSADEQSAPTYSDATGHAEVILERETLKITWKVTFQGLSTPPTRIALFGPENPGANSGVLIDLGVDGKTSPVTGSAVLNDGQLQYLVNTRVYVNVLTGKWKDGEIRCQLRRQLQRSPSPPV